MSTRPQTRCPRYNNIAYQENSRDVTYSKPQEAQSIGLPKYTTPNISINILTSFHDGGQTVFTLLSEAQSNKSHEVVRIPAEEC